MHKKRWCLVPVISYEAECTATRIMIYKRAVIMQGVVESGEKAVIVSHVEIKAARITDADNDTEREPW